MQTKSGELEIISGAAMAFAIAHNQGYRFEYTNNMSHTIPPGDMKDNSNHVRRDDLFSN